MIQRRHFLGSLGAFLATSGSMGHLAQAFTPRNPRWGDLHWECQIVQPPAHNAAHRIPVVTGVSLQNPGDLLAIVGDDHHVCLYDTRQERYVEHLDRHTDWVRSTTFSPNGQQLATAGNDRTVYLWNCSDWTKPVMAKRHREAIFQVAFSNDGTRLATVGFDAWLRIYDVTTGAEVAKLACPCPDMHAVAYSSDDQLLAVGGRNGTIRVWETPHHKLLGNFTPHRKRIRTIQFSADQQIVSAGDDQIVQITDPYQRQPQRSFPRMPSKIYSTALLENNLLAVGGSDNQIHLWQLADLQKTGTLKGHTGTVACLDYAAHRLVSGSYDTQVRIWSTQRHTSVQDDRRTGLRQGWNRKLK